MKVFTKKKKKIRYMLGVLKIIRNIATFFKH